MPENEIKNITSANAPQDEYAYYDDYRDFRGMNYFLLMIIAAAMLPWIFGSYQLLGFNITGWTWVIPLVLSGLICLKNIRIITFPMRLWLIWVGLLSLYWFLGIDNPNATQSYVQMLSPIVVGCAASTFRADNWQLDNVVHWLTRLTWFACTILIIRMPMLLTGILPGYGFMAAEMIGLLLLGACYASFYACGSHRHLYYYIAMVAITLIALVRGPIVSMLSCLPLTLAPFKINKRLIMCALLIICAIILFNTERFQQRMFYSGSGEITDIRLGSTELKTHGRFAMWDVLWLGVKEEPWLGNGFNSHRNTLIKAGFILYTPHNDWLKLLHDFGIFGIGVYSISMLLQMWFLMNIARWSTGAHQMLAYGAATAFIPYAIIMFTDNVVLYVQFFGNLHFTLIGIVYGALRRETEIIDEKGYQ